MSEDKSLEENFETANARITPSATIGGMGEVSFPDGDTLGSGDVPDVADIDDDEEEAKKDKTKKKLEMEGFKLFTQFNNFVTEGKSNFKFGIKKQYSVDDINQMYGFWGTLDVHMDSESIEEIWNDVWGILTKSWKFSDAGALYYLNAKAGRWLADKVWNDINSQISQPDAIDMILSDYARPSRWKAWAKEYNEFAQEELAESLSEGASNFKVLLKTAREESVGIKIRLGDRKDPGHETWEKISKDTWMNLKTKEELDFNGWAKHADKFNMEGKDLQFENLAGSDDIYEAAVLENAVRDLHFETDADKAEELKIEIGTSQGEVTRRKQIEGGEYSLRRFRKEIKYDETGEDLGVFKPGSYMAATSKLGDGPHKKAVKKIKWNQKMYDQWLEDVASNGGWEHAFDMAQNAKHERGLIDWVKKNHRGEDPMQRIQWDIEAFAESVVNEKSWNDVAKIMDAGLKKAVKKGITTLRYAKDYVKSLERMANKEAKKFFDEYGDFTEDDFIEDVRYNMANEKVKDHFSEWVVLNEKKEDRDGMMKFIKKHMSFVGTSEDFNGSQGGIHVSGENYDDEFKGKQIYDYYSEDYKNREFGVLNSWEKELNKRGWYSEWYDAGTVCIWPL